MDADTRERLVDALRDAGMTTELSKTEGPIAAGYYELSAGKSHDRLMEIASAALTLIVQDAFTGAPARDIDGQRWVYCAVNREMGWQYEARRRVAA